MNDPTALTAAYNNADQTSYTTASISPTANTWLVVDSVSRRNPAHANTPIVKFAGGADFTTEGTGNQNTTDANFPARTTRSYIWTGSSPGSGTVTIDWGAETSIGTGWNIYTLPDTVDTSDPFVQTVVETPAGNNTLILTTLAAFGSSDNRPLIFGTHNVNETMTKDGSIYNLVGSIVTGTSGNISFGVSFGSDTAGADTTHTWTWTTTNIRSAIASEIKAQAAAGGTVLDPFGMSGFFGS